MRGRRADIKRSRNEVKSDARFKGERYERVREFARGIGARNDGLRKLRACDIRERKRGGYEIFLREKGGKERWARVLPDYKEIVLSVLLMLGIAAKTPSCLSEASLTIMSMSTPVVLNTLVWLTNSMSVRTMGQADCIAAVTSDTMKSMTRVFLSRSAVTLGTTVVTWS